MKKEGEVDPERGASSPPVSVFLRHGESWQSSGGIVAMVIGSLFLLRFLLFKDPQMIAMDFPLVLEEAAIPTAPPAHPNSFLHPEEYVKPGTSTHDLDIAKYFNVHVEDSELLHAAQDAATLPIAPGKPRVAFLFILRQNVPLEPLWERFFADVDPDAYSIYTHPSWGTNEFPETSPFHNRTVSTKGVQRFDISLVDVVRRLLAFALLDSERANMWFVLVSDACIPVRSFPFVYDYLMNSTTSFVESFSPFGSYRKWDSEPAFNITELRKGELWTAMHRRHAGMVVGDVTYYRKFKADCRDACTLDEEYTQTLLHCLDPQGIANRSVTYVDWSDPFHGDSPAYHKGALINATLIAKIQNRTENIEGQYRDSCDDWRHSMRVCVYNGVPNSPCYLFARKFSGDNDSVNRLLALNKSVLNY